MAIYALDEARAKFTMAAPLISREDWASEADTLSRLASGLVQTLDRMALYRHHPRNFPRGEEILWSSRWREPKHVA